MLGTAVVVEDDSGLGRLLSEELNQKGWVSHWTSDPFEALRWMRDASVDVLITDFYLCTEVNGLNLIQWAKQNSDRTLRCAMSGALTLPESALEMFGVELFLKKPFDVALFSDQLRSALSDPGRLSR